MSTTPTNNGRGRSQDSRASTVSGTSSLPSTVPVSSLLPSIPSDVDAQLKAQYALLLQQAQHAQQAASVQQQQQHQQLAQQQQQQQLVAALGNIPFAAVLAAATQAATHQQQQQQPPQHTPVSLAGTIADNISVAGSHASNAPAAAQQPHHHLAAQLLAAHQQQQQQQQEKQKQAQQLQQQQQNLQRQQAQQKAHQQQTQTQTHRAHHHHHHHQQLVSSALVASSNGSLGSTVLKPTPAAIIPGMQHWSLEQLNNHVALLRQLGQPIPQSLTLLLGEATRREDRRKAKRLANRKSASTSRARKKAMVQQMTELNTRLKRQALILALLPDLVIVIDVNGVITFCSEQVESVLKYRPESILGSRLTDLLVPSSRGRLMKLVKSLAYPEKTKAASGGSSSGDAVAAVEATGATGGGGGQKAKRTRVEDSEQQNSEPSGKKSASVDNSIPKASVSSVAVVSDPSFPMTVVKVAAAVENEQSDTSTSRDSKRPSSLTNSASLTRSPTAESLGNNGSNSSSEDTDQKTGSGAASKDDKKKKAGKPVKKGLPSSDTSNTSSSLDAEVKKLTKANANLERNVRDHNTNRKKRSHGAASYTDDVTGAAVTANNATARLSSLRVPSAAAAGAGTGEPPSSEDDSGYRESNDSREETSSSSASDTSDSNGRRKPLAPTCNVCLIREDMTTVWCEVTSSIRTKDPEEDCFDTNSEVAKATDSNEGDTSPPPPLPKGAGVKELLLCLRPIRDGDEKVDEKHRFKGKREVSDDSNTTPSSGEERPTSGLSSSTTAERLPSQAPLKKRKKEQHRESSKQSDIDADVAESLMMMSSKK